MLSVGQPAGEKPSQHTAAPRGALARAPAAVAAAEATAAARAARREKGALRGRREAAEAAQAHMAATPVTAAAAAPPQVSGGDSEDVAALRQEVAQLRLKVRLGRTCA